MRSDTGAPKGVDADEVFEIIRAAIVRVMEVDPESVQLDTDLAGDLGADSLALVEVVEIVEEQLLPLAGPSFHIHDDDLDDLRTVGQAVDYAVTQLAQLMAQR